MSWEGLTPPYATIVADPPWPYEERVVGFDQTKPMPYSTMSVEDIAALPVAALAQRSAHLYLWTTNQFLWDARDIALGWGFVPSQVLTWCKPMDRVSPGGGTFFGTTEFCIYARASLTQPRRVERAGRLIKEARLAAGLTRPELHRQVRGEPLTGLVQLWETDDSLPNPRDWARMQELLPLLANVERPYVPPPPPKERTRVATSWWEWPRGAHSEKPAAFLDLVEHASPAPYVELFSRAQRLGWDSWGLGYEAAAS